MLTARIVCPNGHLGFAPLKPESLALGVAAGPEFIAADSGSDDIGPGPLGSDTSTTPLAWQTYDLEQMLLASRRINVPMLIGSSGDTGARTLRRDRLRAALLGLWSERRDGRAGARPRPGTRTLYRRAGRRAVAAMAEEVCMTGTRQLLYARLPEVKDTAGSAAFPFDEVMPASAAYRWSVNHTVAVDDPLELFPLHMTEAGE